jgi:hypothetical protein
MSEFLAAAASTMDVPEALVKRSAEARSKSTGTSIDDILQAWAGGGPAPVSSSSPPAPEPEAAVAVEPSDPEGSEPAKETAPAAAFAPPAAPVAVAVMDEPTEDPVDAVALRERVRVAGRVGMGFGVVAAVFVMVFSAQWLLPRAGVAPSETGDVVFAFSVVAGSLLFGSGLIGIALGVAGAAFIRAVTGWKSPGMRLVSSTTSSLVVGGVGGLVTGIVVAAVVAGSGTEDTLDPAVTIVPMLAALVWTLLGWVAGGWMIGALVHAFGVPDGLDEAEKTEGAVVQRRLSAAFGLPLVAVLSIALIVLPAAWVFIQFPTWAPLIAIFLAGAIIAFGFLAAATPGMRITAGEFLVAAAGVGVVVLILASVLFTQGAGH